MARPLNEDPFKRFRFAFRDGFDGLIYSSSKICVKPGTPWTGSGKVTIEALMWKGCQLIEFAKKSTPTDVIVDVYHTDDTFGVGGNPSMSMVLHDVVPAAGRLDLDSLDAMSDENFSFRLTMDYDRLTFIFGDCPLEKIAAVV